MHSFVILCILFNLFEKILRRGPWALFSRLPERTLVQKSLGSLALDSDSQKSITRLFGGSDLVQKQAEIRTCSKKASSGTTVVSFCMYHHHSRSSWKQGSTVVKKKVLNLRNFTKVSFKSFHNSHNHLIKPS